MLEWKNLNEDEQVRIDAIKIFLNRFPKIMKYLFHPTSPELRKTPEEIRRGLRAFSSGEKLLAEIALDLWGTYGSKIHIDDIITTLDSHSFMNCMKAIFKVKKELYGQ